MNDAGMTPEDEHEFYSRPENQVPQGHARRRSLLSTVPTGDCNILRAAAQIDEERPRGRSDGVVLRRC